jgi:hypothetical protein
MNIHLITALIIGLGVIYFFARKIANKVKKERLDINPEYYEGIMGEKRFRYPNPTYSGFPRQENPIELRREIEALNKGKVSFR